MQEYRDYFRPDDDRPQRWLGLCSVTQMLIIANVAVFIALKLAVEVALPLGFGVQDRAVATRVFGYLGLAPQQVLGAGWAWQLLTYTFVHGGAPWWQLPGGMLLLYFFGREVETLYGPRRFLALYLASGVVAGLAYCALQHSSPVPLLGASGAVYAVMTVYALHYPRQRIIFLVAPLQVWIVVTVLIATMVYFQVLAGEPAIGNLAHLGGPVVGVFFYRFQGRLEIYLERRRRDVERDEREHEEEIEARLDTLLEKISREGMGALSRKEREFLKRASRHYQKKA